MKIFICAVFSLMVLSVSAVSQSKSGLQGVWSLTEITATGPNGGTQQMTQPSMYLFTKSHYSIIYVASEKPRPAIDADDISKATADELRDVFVNSFVANAGTYEFKGGKLTLRPSVAKSPSYMTPNRSVTMNVKTDGKALTLVTESNNNGPSANPTTYKLTRVE